MDLASLWQVLKFWMLLFITLEICATFIFRVHNVISNQDVNLIRFFFLLFWSHVNRRRHWPHLCWKYTHWSLLRTNLWTYHTHDLREIFFCSIIEWNLKLSTRLFRVDIFGVKMFKQLTNYKYYHIYLLVCSWIWCYTYCELIQCGCISN